MNTDQISALVNLGSNMRYSFHTSHHGREFTTIVCEKTGLEIVIHYGKKQIRKVGLRVDFKKPFSDSQAIAKIILKRFLESVSA